jgi:hypothetical protein
MKMSIRMDVKDIVLCSEINKVCVEHFLIESGMINTHYMKVNDLSLSCFGITNCSNPF